MPLTAQYAFPDNKYEIFFFRYSTWHLYGKILSLDQEICFIITRKTRLLGRMGFVC